MAGIELKDFLRGVLADIPDWLLFAGAIALGAFGVWLQIEYSKFERSESRKQDK